jgi:serine/threonine-protein kinase
MGSVWVADHEALRTEVVVKFIASELKGSKEATERFSREAAAAAQVKSPHVVQTFDHGVTPDGLPYIVMELLDGEDLGVYLDKQKTVPPELAVQIVAQLARALDRAHEKGIVHRDIKPGNIFLCYQGGADDAATREVFVKLLDFGIAKGVDVPKVDSNTKTGAMIGSPFYMSPEQILGSKGIDHRSDLWSVGVVAYESLTGAKPFDAETMGGLAIKIHSEPLPLPSRVRADLPPSVDAWFQRACARNVDERFTSAREMAEELARAVGGEMPRSLEVPRISTGSSDVAAGAPTLVAGASTVSGVVRPAGPASTRGRAVRIIGLGAALVMLGFGTFVGVKWLRGPRGGEGEGGRASASSASASAQIAPEQSGARAAAASGVGAASAAPVVSASSAPEPVDSSAPGSTVASPEPRGETAAEPSSPAPSRPASPKHRAGHAGRPRPKDSGNTASVAPLTSQAPAPPQVTASPPPANSRDIF